MLLLLPSSWGRTATGIFRAGHVDSESKIGLGHQTQTCLQGRTIATSGWQRRAATDFGEENVGLVAWTYGEYLVSRRELEHILVVVVIRQNLRSSTCAPDCRTEIKSARSESTYHKSNE